MAVTLRLTVCKARKTEVSATFALSIRIPRFQPVTVDFDGLARTFSGVLVEVCWAILLGNDFVLALAGNGNSDGSGDNLVMMILMTNVVCRKASLDSMKPLDPCWRLPKLFITLSQ